MSLRNDNIRMMAGGEVENQPSKPIRLLSLFSGIGAFEKAKAAGISNSQLYKQAGNSIVVNVLQYIFRNLFKGGVTNEA